MENIIYLSVSDLVSRFNLALEHAFPVAYFQGEISQLTRAQSGHLYFTVKDQESQISAVMWRGPAQQLGFEPVAGLQVLCHGRPNVYSKSGRLQVVVNVMLPAGQGLLQKKFLELKAKLEKEGLFAPERKRALPFLPKAVGVVTSATGAVIHDIQVKIRERFPAMPIYLADVRVQGEGAAQEIAAGIRLLDQLGQIDVIIVARGGGSLEDLWAFNEEVVVRAIFASRTPVVSGVGHEVDVTLSDLAADARAPTPTAAAEMAVPRRDDLLRRISELERRLWDVERWLEPRVQDLDELAMRLRHRIVSLFQEGAMRLSAAAARLRAIQPASLLAVLLGRVRLCEERMAAGTARCLAENRRRLEISGARLKSAFPAERIDAMGERLLVSRRRMERGLAVYLQRRGQWLDNLGGRLDAVSPRRVMARGFSMVQRDGELVRSAVQLSPHDQLRVSFVDGAALASVTEVFAAENGPDKNCRSNSEEDRR